MGRLRTAGLAAVLATMGAGLHWATGGVLDELSTTDLESMIRLGFAALAWSIYVWLVLAASSTALAAAPGGVGRIGRAVASRITSHTARRVLHSTLGIAVATPLGLGAADAAPVDGSSTTIRSTQPTSTETRPTPKAVGRARTWQIRQARYRLDEPIEPPSSLDLGSGRARATGDRVPVPDRPTVGTTIRYAVIPPSHSGPAVTAVVVRRGDSLWAITARELGRAASNSDIALRWPRWHATNRRVIGNDPDLIRPGQVLRKPPDQPSAHRKDRP